MKCTTTGRASFESDERKAIARPQLGDDDAFEYLNKAHCKRVYGVYLRMIKNPADAEDLTQGFFRLFQKIGTFRGEAGFSIWLHRVTVNVVLMHLRRNKPTEILVGDLERYRSSDEDSFELGSCDTAILGAIDRVNLTRAARKLPFGYKHLFLLYDVIGYEDREIAGLLGCARLVVQNRSFTSLANDCGDYYKRDKRNRRAVSPRRKAEIRLTPKLENERYIASVLNLQDLELRNLKCKRGADSGSKTQNCFCS